MITKILKVFDQTGGVWLGLWTASVIGLSVYVAITGKDLPGGVVASYAAALTAFAAHSVSKVVTSSKQTVTTVEPAAKRTGFIPDEEGEDA